MNVINKRYLSRDYLNNNPSWDVEDSPWKAMHVEKTLAAADINPKLICEVGCGAGGVLSSLKGYYPGVKLSGYDIAPDAEKFWHKIREEGIDLYVGDFFSLNKTKYDVVLLLDVLEHISDPHQFLSNIKPFSEHVVIHFPLDLSVLSVLRESPLLHVRRKVGHIHFFTKGLALEFLDECDMEILAWNYTNAAFSAPQRSVKTKLMGMLRKFIYLFNKDAGVRLIGGETLMVVAKFK